jgi:hypothetical protein
MWFGGRGRFVKTSSQIHSPCLVDIVDSGIGLSTYAGVNFIPPVRDYEFGYCSTETLCTCIANSDSDPKKAPASGRPTVLQNLTNALVSLELINLWSALPV